MTERLFIGAMSGTSCDGVDAALVRVRGVGGAVRAEFLHLTSLDFEDLRPAILAARRGPRTAGDFADVEHRVAARYAECVLRLLAETGVRAADVTAVAAHGQTLFHAPPVSWQAFDPSLLANRVGIDVVSDLRRADLAAGGHGAPLVPFGDWVLFRSASPRVLVNVGGISNVTVLPADNGDDGDGNAAPGGGLDAVLGYDVGPGNCLSDWLMSTTGEDNIGGGTTAAFDDGGRLALAGRPLGDVTERVLADAFFGRPGPKSTDTPQMIALFQAALTARPAASIEDKLATANAIVAAAITREVRRFGPAEVFVAGGGVRNACLMGMLGQCVGTVKTTDTLGVPAQAREAVAFALLAAAHVDRFACYMPKVTGARRAVVLGSLSPGRV